MNQASNETGLCAPLVAAMRELTSAAGRAADACADLTIAMLGPGYFFVEELCDNGEWYRFGGGPVSIIVVAAHPGRGEIRYVKHAD